MSMYIYLKTESNCYTVGHYNPQGVFIPESDWKSPNEASARVHFLNGGKL